jgi:hypothetical protein
LIDIGLRHGGRVDGMKNQVMPAGPYFLTERAGEKKYRHFSLEFKQQLFKEIEKSWRTAGRPENLLIDIFSETFYNLKISVSVIPTPHAMVPKPWSWEI